VALARAAANRPAVTKAAATIAALKTLRDRIIVSSLFDRRTQTSVNPA
jgi:hypothetical protein